MKKILLLVTLFSMVFTSCDPLEDINTELDAVGSAIVGEVSYTLTDEDYDALDLSSNRFDLEDDDPKTVLPEFLADKYPVWGKGSSALVGYELNIGYAFNLDNYTLVLEDYTASGSSLLGFEDNVNPEDYLTDVVTAKIESPNEGDFVAASFYQYTGDAYTVTPTVFLDENFDYGETAGDLTSISTDKWSGHSGAGDGPVGYTTESLTITEYPSSTGGALTISNLNSEDVNTSISPIITEKIVYLSALVNFSEVTEDGSYFLHLMEEDGSYNYSARIGAKASAGKIKFGIGATSSTLTYTTEDFDLNTTYLIVATYNIEEGSSNLYVLTSVLDAEPILAEASSTGGGVGNSANRVGVRQHYQGPTGVIDGIRVGNTWSSIMSNDDLEDEVVGTKESNTSIYTFADDAWGKISSDEVYSLTTEDFESIGIESFGSSTSPDDYLATFLKNKFPYAQEGDELKVMYDYVSSSSGAQIRGDLYTYTAGNWTGYESTISTSLQLAHDGTAWVPDNTIKYELVGADYDLIADTYRTEDGYASAVANLESYGNISVYNWEPEQIDAIMNTVIVHNYPGMEEEQKFAITVYVYDGSSHNIVKNYILKDGVYVLN